jgi:hypothetical protein
MNFVKEREFVLIPLFVARLSLFAQLSHHLGMACLSE